MLAGGHVSQPPSSPRSRVVAEDAQSPFSWQCLVRLGCDHYTLAYTAARRSMLVLVAPQLLTQSIWTCTFGWI